MHERFVMNSPIGRLYVEVDEGYLLKLEYHSRLSVTARVGDRFARQVKQQIEAYFDDGRYVFDLPLRLQGTAFQKKVWAVMRRIPAGRVLTYGEISAKLASSARAVGNACHANPVPLVVPCHRVVAKTGIGGFGGETRGRNIRCKSWLLQHEGVVDW